MNLSKAIICIFLAVISLLLSTQNALASLEDQLALADQKYKAGQYYAALEHYISLQSTELDHDYIYLQMIRSAHYSGASTFANDLLLQAETEVTDRGSVDQVILRYQNGRPPGQLPNDARHIL